MLNPLSKSYRVLNKDKRVLTRSENVWNKLGREPKDLNQTYFLPNLNESGRTLSKGKKKNLRFTVLPKF